jgi:hypothetical protein
MNDFAECLKRSHAASNWPGWEPLYRRAFPQFAAMVDHRQNGEHQAAGIDRSITFANSKQILVDEKVRGRNKITGEVYDDILLEVLSDETRKTPGWVVKALRADYIAYLIAPLGICHLLPVIQLQSAWARYGADWRKKFGTKRAQNRSWVTLSVPVPVDVLYPAIGGCLHLRFEAFDPDAPAVAVPLSPCDEI